MILGIKYYTHSFSNSSSCSSVIKASHLSNGHDADSDLVLKVREQPHSLQHGAVPFTAHFLPFDGH
jgi:hypothetical protein